MLRIFFVLILVLGSVWLYTQFVEEREARAFAACKLALGSLSREIFAPVDLTGESEDAEAGRRLSEARADLAKHQSAPEYRRTLEVCELLERGLRTKAVSRKSTQARSEPNALEKSSAVQRLITRPSQFGLSGKTAIDAKSSFYSTIASNRWRDTCASCIARIDQLLFPTQPMPLRKGR